MKYMKTQEMFKQARMDKAYQPSRKAKLCDHLVKTAGLSQSTSSDYQLERMFEWVNIVNNPCLKEDDDFGGVSCEKMMGLEL
jgi:hypothetical protein